MEIRRIAILTLNVGGGRLRASQAIHQALYDGADNVEVRTIDALELAEPWFLRFYVYPRRRRARCATRFWRRLSDWRKQKQLWKTAPDWAFRRGCRVVFARLRDFRPHVVVVTGATAAELAALGRHGGWFDAPIVAVQTDFFAERSWARKEIDIYCAGSEEGKRQLISWGVSANRIVSCGVPVEPAFALRFQRAELRRALGLHVNRSVVLVMGGGMAPAPLETIIRNLEMCRQPIQVVVVAGHHRASRLRLEALRRQLALDLHVFGWSDSIPELMGAADLLITSPGGVTISEALAAELPMILAPPISSTEEAHFKFLTERGVGMSVARAEGIPLLVSDLLDDPKQLEVLSMRQRDMARPDAAYSVAQIARALLDKATYIDLLAAPMPAPGESAYLM